jgi:hypothetical protein
VPDSLSRFDGDSDSACSVCQRNTRPGENDAASDPFGQWNACFGFEHFELLRYSGCGAVSRPCNGGNAAPVGEFAQQF